MNASYSHRFAEPLPNPQYDDPEARNYKIFLAHVLCGRYTKGRPGTTKPVFESCVNYEDDPTIYVIFNKDMCIPLYLIEYINYSSY